MRVALCFSGLPRMVENTARYWHNSIITRYPTDVFIHTWDWCDIWNPNTQLKHTLMSLYQPRVLEISTPKTFDTSMYVDRIWPHRTTPAGVLSQWYSVQKSIEFKQELEQAQGSEYDIVVRARFDWYLNNHSLIQNNAVNVALTPTLDGHRFLWNQQPHTGINDQFAYGSSSLMNQYAKLFDNIPNLYSAQGVDFCSELFLKAHLLDCNIEVCDHEMQNGITRLTGIMP
jgi:hypothetical protein